MKKEIFIIIFFQIILLSCFFTKPVKAASCPCVPNIEPQTGQILSCDPQTSNYCGAGWQCKCSSPTEQGCSEGNCIAKSPQGGCSGAGDLSYGISADNQASAESSCKAKGQTCYLSGSTQSYTDEYGYEQILTYECCCTTEPTISESETGSKITGATRPTMCAGNGIETALGCIPTDPKELVGKLLTWGISLAGGIAFLFMLWAGFQYITSTGNPEKLQEASQILTSAIAGLILVIFSVFLLKLVGVTVLGIPGFK